MSNQYEYVGEKAKFDQCVHLLKEQNYKVTDITEKLHQSDTTANLMNGNVIWDRRLRYYGQKVTFEPKHVFVFRHTTSRLTLGTEGMFDVVMNKGGKKNPQIQSPIEGGKYSAEQSWTFALITQRDIFFLTDNIEDELLLELVKPVREQLQQGSS